MRRGSDNCQPQAGTSSINEEDAAFLKHIKVLRKGKPGSSKHRAAIKALRLKADSTLDASKDRTTSDETKKHRGVCFDMRDKGECRRGSKCRFSQDTARIKEAKDLKASIKVFSINMATDESDQALMEADHDFQKGVDSKFDLSYNTSYDDLDYNLDTDPNSENHADVEGVKRGPTINMFTVSKKSRSVYLP